MKTVRNSDVAQFFRNRRLVDVFTGRSWDNHSVFEIVNGNPRLKSGFSLTEKEFSLLKEQLAR